MEKEVIQKELRVQHYKCLTL